MPRQHARADRLPFGDVALDERLQQMLCARIQHLAIGAATGVARCLYYRAVALRTDVPPAAFGDADRRARASSGRPSADAASAMV